MNASTQPVPTPATPSLKVAFLGLGVMGYPMARHLAQAGHAVCVYNRTTAKAEHWLAEIEGKAPAGRHRLALTPREAAHPIGRQPGQRAVRPHPTRIGALVAVSYPFVILSGD